MPPQAPASQPSSVPAFEPVAFLQRYEGRLFTLCNPVEPRYGYCLSEAQVREIRMRYNEDRAHFKRLAIDAVEGRDKAVVRAEGAEALHHRAVIGGALGAAAAVLVGIGLGVLLDRVVQWAAPQRAMPVNPAP